MLGSLNFNMLNLITLILFGGLGLFKGYRENCDIELILLKIDFYTKSTFRNLRRVFKCAYKLLFRWAPTDLFYCP